MEQRYTVTQAAQMLGIKPYVLRYWEEELALSIRRNEQGHRYYTGYDLTMFANIKELKSRGLQLRAIRDVLPRLSGQAAGSRIRMISQEAEKVPEPQEAEVCFDEEAEDSKIMEFQKIMEKLIAQELKLREEGEVRCRSLDAAIRRQQLARKEAAAALDKKKKKIR